MPDRILWTPDGGETVDLTDGVQRFVTSGRGGLWGTGWQVAAHETPGVDGAVVTRVWTGPREVVLPVALVYESEAAFLAGVRVLAAALDGRREGWLRVETALGARQLRCRCVQGLDDLRPVGSAAARAALTFRAYDPFWYAVTETSFSFVRGEATSFFPFFPLMLTSSTIYGDATIINEGDVEAWPVWTLRGPGEDVYLINLTTGERMHLDYAMGGGEQVTIDCRPRRKTVRGTNGENLFAFLSADSVLWALERGQNKIRVKMGGATDESVVQVRFQARFWGM